MFWVLQRIMLARRSSGAAGSFGLREGRAGKGWWMDCLDGEKFQRPGGGGGRAQRAQRRSGGPWPPPRLLFCGPFGPTKRRRPPGVTQRRPPTPTPARPLPALRRLPGSAGRMGRTCGGRRRSGAGAFGPGPRTCPLPGLPGSGRVGFAHPPPPPRAAGFSTNAKKATQKPGLMACPAPPRPPPGKRW